MEILLQPTVDNLREDLGYDDYEDVDEEALLFQQGFDGTPIEVADGEKFEIPEGYIGSIIDDDKVYYLKTEIEEGVWDSEELYGDLEAGSYILNDNVISLVYNDNKLELIDKLRFLVERLEMIRCKKSINISSLISEIDRINNIELPQLMDEAGEFDDLDSENESENNIKDQIDDLLFQAEVLINTIRLDLGLENREAYNY